MKEAKNNFSQFIQETRKALNSELSPSAKIHLINRALQEYDTKVEIIYNTLLKTETEEN